ncbi:sensor histidine kinase [Parapedobacter sp. 10938]|uniref:sensor histidine kinase n=1 Tax=Parapedobacter flavus TaxID=3110225 RepID=UPI002DC04A6B|nr:two-component regulator propeller domain-containing protein [Parapedobacter sp. 10938]MEC3880230.1 two-component regulator propeller domain-containing protein [Parapedobacter sp. 10938]
MRYSWVLWILLTVFSITVKGQQMPLLHYTTHEGLTHANVFTLYQAADHYLYLGTNRGLNKFDGRSFQHFSSSDEYADCVALCITPYKKDSLLIGTYDNGLLMKTDKGLYPLFSHNIPTVISSVIYDGNHIWAIGKDSINKLYKIKGGNIQQVITASKNIHIATPYCVVKAGKEYLLASSNGIYKIHTNGTLVPIWQQIFHLPIKTIVQTRDKTYWVGLQNELIGYKNKTVVKRIPFKGKANLSNILLRSNNELWIATIADGIYILRNDANQLKKIAANIPPLVITDMLEDNDGGIWVATQGKGIYKIDNVNALYFPPSKKLINVNCNALEPLDSHRVLIGSVGTVSIFDNNKLYPLKCYNIGAEDFIYFIKKVGEHLLIGTSTMLIKKSIFPPFKERIIKQQDHTGASISVYCDKGGKIWVGSFGKLFYLNNDRLYSVHDSFLNGRRINTIIEKNGQLYLGTNNGIIAYDDRNGDIKQLYAGYTHLKIFSFKKDKKRRIWAATSLGLMLVKNDTLVPFPLSNRHFMQCNDLFIDNLDHLWAATLEGVFRINLSTMKVVQYKTYARIGEAQTILFHENKLFLGQLDGVSTLMHPQPKNTHPPKFYITSILIDGKQVSSSSTIRLPYKKNHLTIGFTGVSMTEQSKIIYRYKIPQLTDQWQTTQNNSILLTGLAPGDYKLLLATSQNNGGWSRSKELRLIIVAPFWKTTWFWSIIILVVFCISLFFVRHISLNREKKKRKNLIMKNKMAYLKQQALSALINPHFIFNCLNSIQHYLNKNQNNLANEYLADFAHLIRLTIEQSEETFITLREETVRLKLYLSLEKLRLQEKLNWKLIIDPHLDDKRIKIPNMILQPYVENAIWHGIMPKKKGGNISIYMNKHNKTELKIIIEDDGVGFDPDKKNGDVSHKKLGMSIIKERFSLLQHLLHQSFSIDISYIEKAGNKKGTRVILIIPILFLNS